MPPSACSASSPHRRGYRSSTHRMQISEMPPAATREPFARWSESSRRTALAIIAEREIYDVNARLSELDSPRGSWSWLHRPHALVRYDDPRRRYVRGVLAKPLDLEQLRSLLTTSPGAPTPRPDASAVH